MSGRAGWTRRRTIIAVVVGVVVVAGIIASIAILRNPASPVSADPPPATGTAPSAAQSSAAASDPSSPAAGGTAGGAAPSATPTKPPSPYCQQYQDILAGAPDTTEDDGSVNLDQLSQTFERLITKYTTASELAPKKLKPAYAQVIARLKSMKKAVDDRDIDEIKLMLTQLTSLNDSMDEIQRVSKELCG